MLEKKDLEMLAEIVKESVHPISEDMNALREGVKEDMNALRRDVQEDMNVLREDVREDMNALRKDVKEVQLTLENETNRNIKVIAEGHLDLSRKLDDALKVESEKEMLLVRVTSLENEVRRLKAKIEEIA